MTNENKKQGERKLKRKIELDNFIKMALEILKAKKEYNLGLWLIRWAKERERLK